MKYTGVNIMNNMVLILFTLLLGISIIVHAQELVIKNANYLNVVNGLYENGNILISDGIISSITKEKPNTNVLSFDASGKWTSFGSSGYL